MHFCCILRVYLRHHVMQQDETVKLQLVVLSWLQKKTKGVWLNYCFLWHAHITLQVHLACFFNIIINHCETITS